MENDNREADRFLEEESVVKRGMNKDACLLGKVMVGGKS